MIEIVIENVENKGINGWIKLANVKFQQHDLSKTSATNTASQRQLAHITWTNQRIAVIFKI